MNFSKHFIFVAASLLVAYSRQSDAGVVNTITSIGSAIGSGFADLYESLENDFAEGKQHSGFERTKIYFEELSAAAANDGEANEIILNGLFKGIDNIRAAADAAYDGLKEANASSSSYEIITQILTKAFTKCNEHIVDGGARFYLGFGAATEICEDGARQGLNEATEIITHAGGLAFDGFNAARVIAMQGAAAKDYERAQAMLAAIRAVQSIELILYNFAVKAGESAFKAIGNESLIEDSLLDLEEDKAASESPKCQQAIESIENLAKKALSQVTDISKIEAIKVVREGMQESCKIIAQAGKPGYSAMDAAKLIPNKELALATIEKGIADSKKKSVIAVSTAQQALGGAAVIIGPSAEVPFIQAMVIVEKARVGLLNGLQNSLDIGSQGIKHNASEKALSAGYNGVAIAGFTGYAELVNSAEFAFNTIVLAKTQ